MNALAHWKQTLIGTIAWLGALLVSFSGHTEPVPSEPILRIETGAHTGIINRMALLSDAREMVTVADDKTARIWNLSDGSLRAILRVPIGEADEGALYAVASSPTQIAVGGRTGLAWSGAGVVYIFDTASRTMVGKIGGFKGGISTLAFSPDGNRLAVGALDPGGLTVLDIAKKRVALKVDEFQGGVLALTYSPDGLLAVLAGDGTLSIYGANLALGAQEHLSNLKKPRSVAFSPDGRLLAVGDAQEPTVQVYSVYNLTPLKVLNGTNGRRGGFSVVRWTPNGQIYAGGTYLDGHSHCLVRRFDPSTGDAADISVSGDTITDLASTSDHAVLYTTAEPSWGRIDQSDAVSALSTRPSADFRNTSKHLKLSRDGAIVEFSFGAASSRLERFDLRNRSLEVSPSGTGELQGPVSSTAAMAVTQWQNSPSPKVNGKAVALERTEMARSVAVARDGSEFTLGTDFYLRTYAKAGPLWRTTLPAPAWAVDLSADGRLVVAALGDGTIRWYRRADGSELMALFVHQDGKRWVVWTPEGFFDHNQAAADESGASLIGYHLNRGSNNAPIFVSVDQLYGSYYRRDLVLERFADGPEAMSDISDQLRRIGDVHSILAHGQPPRLHLLQYCTDDPASNIRQCWDKQDNIQERHSELEGEASSIVTASPMLRVLVAMDRGEDTGSVVIKRNGAVLDVRSTELPVSETVREQQFEIPLAPGDNEIQISSFNTEKKIELGSSERISLNVQNISGEAAVGSARPTLHILAVGVSDYAIDRFDLTPGVASGDARALVELLAHGGGDIYDRVEATLLLNGDATKTAIVKALEELDRRTKPEDMAVIFLAGHGDAVDGKYYFAPHEIGTGSPDLLEKGKHATEIQAREIVQELFRREGLGQDQLVPLLTRLAASRTVLLLDTCYSAPLASAAITRPPGLNDTIANSVGYASGRFVMTAATQLAIDAPPPDPALHGPQHGLFTTFALRALSGDADLDHNKHINVYEFATFTTAHVQQQSTELGLPQRASYYFSGNQFFDVRSLDVRSANDVPLNMATTH